MKTASGNGRATIVPLALAHLAGLAALQSAVVLVFIAPRLAAVPVALFVIACLAAPFFPGWRFFLPAEIRGKGRGIAVALTFDDGPDPRTTPQLLDLLDRYQVKAAFFVIGEKARQHPQLIKQIVDRGHEIGNHSMHHDPLLMLRSTIRLQAEVAYCNQELRRQGIEPRAFRPPVGIVNPRLWGVLLEQGMYCAMFSKRGIDFGNRRLRNLAKRVVQRLRPGDIIALHDCLPPNSLDPVIWLDQVERIILGVRSLGLRFDLLSTLIDRPVMNAGERPSPAGPVTAFFDSLAEKYDDEQRSAGQSIVRKTEQGLISAWIEKHVQTSDRVLELGAGTGRFTLQLAARSRRITALDISGRMLDVLRRKATATGLSNIDYLIGDIRDLVIERRFDRICAFSAFEYINDLAEQLARLHDYLELGGEIYFTTAHRSFFRFFTQVGNALRQGIWLHARGKKEIGKMLIRAGFHPEQIDDYGLKSIISKGILLEVRARKI